MIPLRKALSYWSIIAILVVTGLPNVPQRSCAASTGTPVSSAASQFYVSPKGNDHWSGRLADPGQNDGPFATLERARDAVRALRRTQPQQVATRVIIRGGTYYLDKPLQFSPEDSGTDEAPVVYCAAAGEKAVLNGGRCLESGRWGEINGRKAWMIDLPQVKDGKWNFRQLFVNGQRRARTRLPKTGEFQIESLPDFDKKVDPWAQNFGRFVYRGNDIQQWHNLRDVDVMALVRWRESRLPIQDVDVAKRIVTFDRKSNGGLFELYVSNPATYYVENVLEALDTPGQWYLDRPLGRLYYLPAPGEDPAKAEIIAPCLADLVRVVGSNPEAPVMHLRIEGITFAHTEWQPPANWAGSSQAACDVPAAITFIHSEQCAVSRCVIEHVGTYGVAVGPGCMDIHVTHNKLCDLGGGGVKVWHGEVAPEEEDGSSRHAHSKIVNRAMRTIIADNEICQGGRLFPSAVGVLVGDSPGNTIIYNHIHHLYYTGISVGWVWYFGKSAAVGNIIEHNHVHDVGQSVLSDLGGIYTLGVSPGTRIRYNIVHDVTRKAYGGWGIYPDDGCSDVLIEKNLVYRCAAGPIFLHGNRNNTVVNNILAHGDQLCRGGEYRWRGSTLQRNILCADHGPVTAHWNPDDCTFDRNLYWSILGKPLQFGGKSFAEWQAAGQDKNSIVADPLFVDADHGDYRLRPGAPATKIGFEPWDLSDVGPRSVPSQ